MVIVTLNVSFRAGSISKTLEAALAGDNGLSVRTFVDEIRVEAHKVCASMENAYATVETWFSQSPVCEQFNVQHLQSAYLHSYDAFLQVCAQSNGMTVSIAGQHAGFHVVNLPGFTAVRD